MALSTGTASAVGPVAVTAARRSRRPADPLLLAGAAVVAALVLATVFGPAIWPVDPRAQDLRARFAPPMWLGGTASHPLGADGLGRDLLARILAGGRTSLAIGAAATLASGALGVTLGVLAGWLGRGWDQAIGWLTDVQLAVPWVVVALALTATLGNSAGTVLLTLALTGWVGFARVVRMQARSLRGAGFVDAARALGATDVRIVARHVAPALVASVAILATQQVTAMILYEAALSFLGLGLGGDAITWGGMAADGQDALLVAPWVAVLPGIAVAAAVLGSQLVGDAVAARAARGG